MHSELKNFFSQLRVKLTKSYTELTIKNEERNRDNNIKKLFSEGKYLILNSSNFWVVITFSFSLFLDKHWLCLNMML